MRGSRRRARAIAIRCFWPPESVTPRSPTSVSYPAGIAVMKSCARAAVAAATTAAVFRAFVEQALVPALRARPEAVVVLDNLAAHKAEVVRAALGRAGLAHRYLPPYSPDLNPIEQAWSKLKARLRAEGARSREELEAALGPALAAITPQDARGWFRLCGYATPD